MTPIRRAVSEGLGTALLLAAVVGSGIMGDRLAGGNVAVALLANTLSTAAALVVLILIFGPVSGAHFNPVVTAVETLAGRLSSTDAAIHFGAQFVGAFAGVAAAHVMFDLPVPAISQTVRAGPAQVFSEAVATFGLVLTILRVSRSRPEAVPYAVGLYIASAYWFTASTSFANPAVTLARCVTDTFAGIRPIDVLGFVLGQCVGAAFAVATAKCLNGPGDRAETV